MKKCEIVFSLQRITNNSRFYIHSDPGPWQQRYCEPLAGVSANAVSKSEMTRGLSQRKSLTYDQVKRRVLLPSQELSDPRPAGVSPGKNKQQ